MMADRPNIVLVHAHDLGRWLSCYGRASVPSPKLSAFADQSVVFDNAFATAPLCTPARSSLFTGLSPHVNGLMGLSHAGWRYRDGVRTLPELLSDAGYDTALIGLQHEDPDPLVLGFEHVGGVGFLPHANSVVDESIAWLDEHRAEAPYFLAVGVWEIHRPWGSKDYLDIDPAVVEVPEYLPDNASTRHDLAEMYGAIGYLDAAIGRLIDRLDHSADVDNTLVIFTTDHGAALPGAKSTLYDAGLEVAMIMRPPARWGQQSRRVQQQVSHLDLVPTLVELAGGSPDPALEGESILTLLQDCVRTSRSDRTLFFEKTYHDGYDPVRALRTPEWKYIRSFSEAPLLSLPKDLEESHTRRELGDAHLGARPTEELYKIDDDPGELDNRAADSAFAGVVAECSRALADWMERTEDPLVYGDIDAPPRPTRGEQASDRD